MPGWLLWWNMWWKTLHIHKTESSNTITQLERHHWGCSDQSLVTFSTTYIGSTWKIFDWLLYTFTVFISGLLFSHTRPSQQLHRSFFSCDLNHWLMTLTFEHNLDSVNMNQHIKYLVQRPSIVKQLSSWHTDTQPTDCTTCTTKLLNILKAKFHYVIWFEPALNQIA